MFILVDLILTAIVCMAIPLIIVSNRKDTITKSEIRKAVIINGVIAWFVFAIIAINQGRTPGAAAVVWSSVCYAICLKIANIK